MMCVQHGPYGGKPVPTSRRTSHAFSHTCKPRFYGVYNEVGC